MNNRFDMHHIQRAIILSLVAKSPRTFTELQPPRVANNTFSYHLKKLVDNGYVEHVDARYVPTRKALKLVAANGGQRQRISSPIVITMFYVVNNDGEVLLLNRNLKPFQGWYGLPSGVIHAGEMLDEAATRELFEKTGIQPTDGLCVCGVLDFQYREDGTDDLFVHALAFLYSYHYSGSSSVIDNTSNRFGQLSWSRLGRSHILPEVLAAKEIYEHKAFVQQSVQFVEPADLPTLAL